MTIEQCRALNCAHVSEKRRCRNCGFIDCSRYNDFTFFEERWWEEEDWEFDDCMDEE